MPETTIYPPVMKAAEVLRKFTWVTAEEVPAVAEVIQSETGIAEAVEALIDLLPTEDEMPQAVISERETMTLTVRVIDVLAAAGTLARLTGATT